MSGRGGVAVSMLSHSHAHEDTDEMTNCNVHGERLTRIEVKLEAIHEQVSKTNGRTTANESAIAAMATQLASQQTMWMQSMQYRTAMEKRIEDLETSMGKLKDWRAEQRGGTSRSLAIFERLATIVALVVAAWSAWAAHAQVAAALAQK